MKKITFIFLSIAAVTVVGMQSASAGGIYVSVPLSARVSVGPPVYVAPAPVYVAPTVPVAPMVQAAPVYVSPAPTVVYQVPPPVVYAPAPVYVARPVISFGFGFGFGHGGYYRGHGGGHGGYGHHR